MGVGGDKLFRKLRKRIYHERNNDTSTCIRRKYLYFAIKHEANSRNERHITRHIAVSVSVNWKAFQGCQRCTFSQTSKISFWSKFLIARNHRYTWQISLSCSLVFDANTSRIRERSVCESGSLKIFHLKQLLPISCLFCGRIVWCFFSCF